MPPILPKGERYNATSSPPPRRSGQQEGSGATGTADLRPRPYLQSRAAPRGPSPPSPPTAITALVTSLQILLARCLQFLQSLPPLAYFGMAGAREIQETRSGHRRNNSIPQPRWMSSEAGLSLPRNGCFCSPQCFLNIFSALPLTLFSPLCFLRNSFPAITSALPKKTFSFLSHEHFPQMPFTSFPSVPPS